MLQAIFAIPGRLIGWAWRSFRHAVNVGWLALNSKRIGWIPKSIGALAALVGIAPIEWIPGIDPLFVLSAELVLIPALLWFAWWLVPDPRKLALSRAARNRPIQKGFLAILAVIFIAAFAVDTYMDFVFPGQDPVSQMLDPYLDDLGEILSLDAAGP